MKKIVFSACMAALALSGCCKPSDPVTDNMDFARTQLTYALDVLEKARAATPDSVREAQGNRPKLFPRGIAPDGSLFLVAWSDWTSGYFPGSLWYMYEYTGDEKWREAAAQYTAWLERVPTRKGMHDIGLMANDSFGNGYRLTGDTTYRDAVVQAAKTLALRYNPAAGVVQSWNTREDKDWKLPVIIDGMMVIEIMFRATEMTGDSTYYHIAVHHANTTMKNHYRDDFSSYHLVDYDPETGEALQRITYQGAADESSWARGQAWGLYGFTMMYDQTRDPAYLAHAEKIAARIFSFPTMPANLIPYWDYNAPNIPDEPRDVSAATITMSALYKLSTFDTPQAAQYKTWADTILENLKAYRAKKKGDYGFLLLHSVGNYHNPRVVERDTPLNYADYYFLQALLRKQSIEARQE